MRRRVEVEARDDLVARRRSRRRGERHARNARETALELVEHQVVLAKVVAPLRDAMRLVDRDQRQRHAGEHLERLLLHEPLGRDVEKLQGRALEIGDHVLLLGTRECRVQERRPHARVAQRADLILHQRDQRRDHDADPVAQQRGDLVAERLAAAGRHQHERVAARFRCRDDRALLAAEGFVAEHLAQHAARRVFRRSFGSRGLLHGPHDATRLRRVRRVKSRARARFACLSSASHRG